MKMLEAEPLEFIEYVDIDEMTPFLIAVESMNHEAIEYLIVECV